MLIRRAHRLLLIQQCGSHVWIKFDISLWLLQEVAAAVMLKGPQSGDSHMLQAARTQTTHVDKTYRVLNLAHSRGQQGLLAAAVGTGLPSTCLV